MDIQMEIITKKVRLTKNGPSNETIFVLGPTGSGKTTLIANLLLDDDRFVIFDAKNDYYPEFFGNSEHVIVVDSVVELAEALNNGFDRIIFRVPSVDSGSDELLDAALGYICLFQTENIKANENFPGITVSIDEVNRFTDPHSAPQFFKEINDRGRDYKIKKLFGGQWFNSMPTWLRSNFSEIYTFRYVESAGLRRLADYGFDPEQVKNLPAYNCLHGDKNGVKQINLEPAGMVPRRTQTIPAKES